jgi:hypothetical protein
MKIETLQLTTPTNGSDDDKLIIHRVNFWGKVPPAPTNIVCAWFFHAISVATVLHHWSKSISTMDTCIS